jgi:hypothetical protein
LANQLAAQEQPLRGKSDAGQSLFYRLLRQQYEQCLERFGHAFNNAALLLDTPFDAH